MTKKEKRMIINLLLELAGDKKGTMLDHIHQAVELLRCGPINPMTFGRNEYNVVQLDGYTRTERAVDVNEIIDRAGAVKSVEWVRYSVED